MLTEEQLNAEHTQKVDGVDRTMTVKEWLGWAGKATAADSRFREAAELARSAGDAKAAKEQLATLQADLSKLATDDVDAFVRVAQAAKLSAPQAEQLWDLLHADSDDPASGAAPRKQPAAAPAAVGLPPAAMSVLAKLVKLEKSGIDVENLLQLSASTVESTAEEKVSGLLRAALRKDDTIGRVVRRSKADEDELVSDGVSELRRRISDGTPLQTALNDIVKKVSKLVGLGRGSESSRPGRDPAMIGGVGTSPAYPAGRVPTYDTPPVLDEAAIVKEGAVGEFADKLLGYLDARDEMDNP
jgi:hypothetical protein